MSLKPGNIQEVQGTTTVSDGDRVAVAAGKKFAADSHGPPPIHTGAAAGADDTLVGRKILPPKPEFVDGGASAGVVPRDKKAPPDASVAADPFATMKPGDIVGGKDGKTRSYTVDGDGTQHRITSSDVNTSTEEILHPDKSRELITQKRGSLETQKWDSNGQMREDNLSQQVTADGKQNFNSQKSWDKNGKLTQDNSRWLDQNKVWHEDNTSNFPDGSSRHVVMDGDVTTTKDTQPDGSWSSEVKTANVDKINPNTLRHYKTMTVSRSHFDPKTGVIVTDPTSE
jgi:hypothetical protein